MADEASVPPFRPDTTCAFHERRLETVEAHQQTIAEKIGSLSASQEQTVEAVRALDGKMDLLPDKLEERFSMRLQPIHERLGKVEGTIEGVIKDHGPIIEAIKKREAAASVASDKRKAALLTIVAATVGAMGKVLVDWASNLPWVHHLLHP